MRTSQIKALSWLLVVALAVGTADEGLAGGKKKKKKKKGKADSTQTAGQEESGGSPSRSAAPPRVVRDVEKRLLAYDTAGARRLLAGESLDTNLHLQVADGRVLEQEGNHSQAVGRLSAAADQASDDPAPLVYLGEAYLRARNSGSARDAFTRAEQRARRILDGSPRDAEALYHLGVAQQGLGRYDQAVATLERARAESPRDARIVYQIGATRAFQKNWTAAIDTLTEAIEMDSGIAYAYYYRGLSAGEAGRNDLLVNDLDRFLAMAPSAPEAEMARRLLGGL